ncbi:MAG: class I SAM-dependent methyltransferase [Candidatus Hermodarchaeota archaeon]
MSEDKTTYQKSAQYYDILYQWKDYDKDVDDFLYLSKEILGRSLTSLLDLGCGTGNHAIHFARKGISVVGVDLSKDQVAIARSKAANEALSIEFIVSDMTKIELDQQFDAAAIFFGGFGYLLADEEIIQFFNNVHRLVKPDGFLFFEFWHTLGVKPNSSHYTIGQEKNLKIIRVSTSEFDITTGIVTIPMQHFVVRDKQLVEEFIEAHRLRTYTIPHLKSLIHQSPWNITHLYSGNFSDDTEKRTPKWDDFRLFAVLKH